MLAVWALWVLDPVSRLGDQFYLGELFHYEGPGFWFGLPTGSQVGFALTAGVLLAVLFRLDRAAPDTPVDGLRQHPHLVALLTYHGQVFHLAAVGFWIGRRHDRRRRRAHLGAGGVHHRRLLEPATARA